MKTQRTVIVDHGDYELVKYITGETRIENTARNEASDWLDADERAEIEENTAIMAGWNLDNEIETEPPLLDVAEGIMDSAAEEYRADNLASIESVQRYAEAIDIDLSDEDALRVLTACRNMQERIDAGEIPGTDDWYHEFQKPLSHGGPRPGAGRPPKHGEPSVSVQVRIPESLVAAMDARTESRSDIVVEAVRQYLGA